MIRALRQRSALTILLTTHYMEEADKLCERIAIVDHGKLVALDTPMNLKDSIPGADAVEAEFENAPPDWLDQLRRLAQARGRKRARGSGAHRFTRRSHHGCRADGSGACEQSNGEESVRSGHHARRCVSCITPAAICAMPRRRGPMTSARFTSSGVVRPHKHVARPDCRS